MVRKLPVLITIGFLSLSPVVPSYGLGFGNIKLNSALNEPFSAEIDLLSATVDETTGLTVKLASKEAFTRSGIDRPTFLNGIHFEIKSRPDDTFYILLTSRQPIREPFLNFLLELNWYNGRILREYTVLLDPPGRIIKQPAVVATPEVKSPEIVVREPEVIPEPVAVEPEAAFEPEPVATELLPGIEPEPVVADSAQTVEPELVTASAPVVELEPVVEPEPAQESIPEPEISASIADSEPVVEVVEEDISSKPIKSGLAAILAK
ncbi:MAG: hypothetical protein OEY89_14715, partial [Gammaproteobacteria bacterium]|nr:hypothetical protein [Gammaproteobacteria bacterium]